MTAASLPEIALDAAVGAALVLDRELRIATVTPSAAALLGEPLQPGVLAPDLFCAPAGDDAAPRPVVAAMARGEAFQSLVHVMTDTGEQPLRIRGAPLPGGAWLLVLEPAPIDAPSAQSGPIEFHGMWTQDDRMKACFRIIERVAETDDPVLVRGETGAGKELVAAAIHRLSGRPGPYKAINCAALPAALLESELFGHVRGAFTGAHKDTPGHVQLAHRGTLFLDEVAELPLELQAKLLRVLETRTVLPVGAREPVAVDVRVVSATHRALRSEVEAGRFRADLMYRLRVVPIYLPPLRDRTGDVTLLCERFLPQLNATRRRQVTRIAPAALTALSRHDWRGNVRELRNALAYAHTMGDGPTLELGHLPPELLESQRSTRFVTSSTALPAGRLGEPETARPRERAPLDRARIERALADAGGNRNDAARRLGISRITLWRHLKELGG